MTFRLAVPRRVGEPLSLSLEPGQVIFILGANGAGKSSILQRFSSENFATSHRISAHRQTWFQSNTQNLSPHQKRNTEQNIKNEDNNTNSRWTDPYAQQRASIAMYDLIDAENVRARLIASAVDSGDLDLAKDISKKDSPLKIINELFRLSNIPIEISIIENEQVMASRNGGSTYSVAELSDGERNALLIAANVLTTKPGHLLLIDEPERHLHRSIISPLLTLLFAKRNDCAFVVSTHDPMLPLDNAEARTLLLRSCEYSGNHAISWDADLIEPQSDFDEIVLRDILGNRRKLLFVEGTNRSLDKPLYSLLFPNMSVIAKETCRDVETCVSSIRTAQNLHWLAAYGVVDSDQRPAGNIEELRIKGIHALTVYSVESIYYCSFIISHVARRQQSVIGGDADIAIKVATESAIDAVGPCIRRLCERVIEWRVRQEIFSKLPKRSDFSSALPIHVNIDIPAIIDQEIEKLTEYCNSMNLDRITSSYPVRETPALDRIAQRLGFQGKAQYENAVRKLLMDDDAVLARIRSMFGSLIEEISADEASAVD
ncbi:MAG: AAA family ATPase [Paracoccaceae bacterium]